MGGGEPVTEEQGEGCRAQPRRLHGIGGHVPLAELHEVAVQPRRGQFGGGETLMGEVQVAGVHPPSVLDAARPAQATSAACGELSRRAPRPRLAGVERFLRRRGRLILSPSACAAASSASSFSMASVS